MNAPRLRCSACGAAIEAAALVFACPAARPGDDIDHVLVPDLDDWAPTAPDAARTNPFLRYRRLLTAWHLARASGLPDEAYLDLVERLDEALLRVDGRPLRVTPFAPDLALAAALGRRGTVWIKDETGNTAGSHKARHLASVLLTLLVAERAGLAAAGGARARPLAIASCGNAALAGAVLARAADWPIKVFIPEDAEPSVVARLHELGAQVTVCRRSGDTAGDPCVAAYRAAVADGALPFSVQGNENGLAVEGGRTLGWEIAEGLAAADARLDALFVQVGGGALASGCMQGLATSPGLGLAAPQPRLFTVQTMGAGPLARAWQRFAERFGPPRDEAGLATALTRAAQARSTFMWPWESVPASVAHGILDDETYDWRDILGALARSRGRPLTAPEDDLLWANRLVREVAGIAASATGSAGLAGLRQSLPELPPQATVAVLVTGENR